MGINIELRNWRRWTTAALLGLTALTGVVPAEAEPWTGRFAYARPVFGEVWRASDEAVASGRAARSYTWGPSPWFDYKEFYRQSPNGLRQVQYFDKARMEINNPSVVGARGVTNGLLTVEMVSGRLKTGDTIGFEDNVQRQPANVPVAGDPGNENPSAPTYASFQGVATIDNGYRDPDRIGQRVGSVLDKSGNRTNNAELAKDPATEIVTYNTITGHNVPRVFRDFIQNGPVDGTFAFGYPITDAYWVRAKVAGVDKDVLVQLYERRVVTYTPSNAAAFRVEMGNVGQHYFQWRYPHLGQPWQPGEYGNFNLPVAFASKRATADHWETFYTDENGAAVTQITSGQQETVPYSWRRAYGQTDYPRLMTDSKRDSGIRKLFSISLGNASDVRQHSISQATPQLFNPAVSPDGTQIALVVQDGDFSTLAIQPFTRDNAYPMYLAFNDKKCVYQSPTWLPDGSGLVYAMSCEGGKFAIYRAELQYNFMSDMDISVSLVNPRALTNTPTADNYFPRVSPDGARIVFSSNRNGQGDLYLIKIDGTGEQRLTNDPADDGAASWSRDSSQLVFDSNSDGDYEIYRMDLNGGLPRAIQLTNNNVDDRWPLWYQ